MGGERIICEHRHFSGPIFLIGQSKVPVTSCRFVTWDPVVLSSDRANSDEVPRVLRIATRKSPLAMWQAEHVAKLLEANSVPTKLVPLVSGGDVDMRPIDGTRQVGLFTKRIQQALADDEADIAVHSLKDLPTEPDPRFALAAVPVRETVDDSLVSPNATSLSDLRPQARIGTGSRRRAAQLLWQRDDLEIHPIRGNVQTRLEKLRSENFDAIVLAEAGLVRLKMAETPRVRLPLDQMLPAPGQGALGIETRSDDTEAIDCLAEINDPATRAAVTAERTLLAELHGGCLAPIAAYAELDGNELSLRSVVLSVDGSTRLADSETCRLPDDSGSWESLARELATEASRRLIADGARDLISQAR